jgi:hypothetical protein
VHPRRHANGFEDLVGRLESLSRVKAQRGTRTPEVTLTYVISPETRYAYRDSGLPGDTVSRQIVEQALRALAEGGFAHILVSWAHAPDDPWSAFETWVEGSGCDCWLLHFGSEFAEQTRKVAVFGRSDRVRDRLENALQVIVVGSAGRGAVDKNDADSAEWVLGRERNEADSEHGQRSFVALANQEKVVAALAMEYDFGRALDGIGGSKENSWRNGGLWFLCAKHFLKFEVFNHIGGGVAFEDDGAGIGSGFAVGDCASLGEIAVADLVG